MLSQPKYQFSSSPLNPMSRPQRELLPSTLMFNNPTTLLAFMSTLESPSQLLSVSSLHITLPPLQSQAVNQVATGVHLMLRYADNLQHLQLHWATAPSSVLAETSFHLATFSSTMTVDATVVSFLEAQPGIRTLLLSAWGAHLPPPFPTITSNPYAQYPPAPPLLSPTALPALAEFTGHAEVAAQLAAGGRPLQIVRLTSGFPASSRSPTAAIEWREIMSGLKGSPLGVRHLTIVGLENFGLEVLAEIGRHLLYIESLSLRIQRTNTVSDILRWGHWKSYILTLANLEHIAIELVDSSPASSAVYPYLYAPVILPTQAQIRDWHSTSPMLLSISVSTLDASLEKTGYLCAWEWMNLRWVDRALVKR